MTSLIFKITLGKAVISGILLVAGLVPDGSFGQDMKITGISEDDALKYGERMYREGVLPSGKPMTAMVEGDIPVTGKMFSCSTCHLRSGLGTIEGTVITLPVNGENLYKPLSRESDVIRHMRKKLPDHLKGSDIRPAYDDITLARALRSGVDPGGRVLDRAMPRYVLSDGDMEILVFYMKNLSSRIAPGVTAETLSFATVITGDVSKEDRTAMVDVLRAYIDDINSQSRKQEMRARKGPFYRLEYNTGYRRLELDVWELKGPPETWESQLMDYYRKKPVFALLGGISKNEWGPVHRFCEKNRIPNIFPVTDYPVLSEDGWYTLYFSKGLYQEGEAVAHFLREKIGKDGDVPVVQVIRDTKGSRVLSEGFHDAWLRSGMPGEDFVLLGNDEVIDKNFWERLATSRKKTVVLLWLTGKEIGNAGMPEDVSKRPHMLFLSYSLAGQKADSIPDGIKDIAYMTYPYDLPQDSEKKRFFTKKWMMLKNIEVTDINLQSKMYFLGRMITQALTMMRRDFYREYFLETFDMMIDQNYTIAAYPNLSFGPGQRYASKGCYIVRPGKGHEPDLIPVSAWITY